ncbi:MAG: hypothetical protein QOJ84_2686 [Bradyrhizobium sp.]|jgi:hypothetical protein|nr:hypothetical protein [Bradyrhizobium sp.]
MLSRALSLATVMLLIGGFAAAPVRAQNLEAGKSPSQIFGGTCAACHKSPRGLLKTVAPGSLPGFLRQHYTTSGEMASVLSAYLVSNGAADTRYIGSQPKQAKDAKQEPSGQPTQLDRYGRPIRRAPTQEAARPAGEGQAPAAATEERGPDGRRLSAKQRLSKRGKPGEELPKTDAAKTDAPMSEAAKDEVSKDEKPNTAKDEASTPEAKPEEGKSEPAKLDAAKGEGAKVDVPLRADPVPAVTPAPKSLEGETKPVQSAAPTQGDGPTASPASSAAASNAAPEPQPGEPTSTPAPASVAVSAPPPPPVAPAGPPAPPISQ